MTQTPATQAMDALQDQQAELAQEIEAIGKGEKPEEIHTPEGEFNNLEWLLCESAAIDMECKAIMSLMNAEGDIPYDDPYDEEAMNL